MKTVKSYNHRNGTTYVYEVLENHWNPEKKRGEPKKRLIGKLDQDGNMIPTGKRGRPKKISQSEDGLPAQPSQPAPEADYEKICMDFKKRLLEKDRMIHNLERQLAASQAKFNRFYNQVYRALEEQKGALDESKPTIKDPQESTKDY